jgi:DNA-binding transcriptional ArsR family regulator
MNKRAATDTTTTASRVERAQATEWASWFSALGEPTRVLILHLLSTEGRALTVGDITTALDVGQSTISHHLAKLAEVGFVLVEYVGSSSRWRVNSECLDRFPSAAEMIMGRVPVAFIEAIRGAA